MTAPVDVGTTRSFSELMAELARSGTPIELPSGSFYPNAIAPLDANENDVLRIVNGEVVWGANVIGFDLARGTTDRITIEKSNDGLAIINIASTYIGQTSITTVGTLTLLNVQGKLTVITGDIEATAGKLTIGSTADITGRITGTDGLTVSGSTSVIGVDSDASTNVRIGGLLFTVFPATTFLDSILVTGPTSGIVGIGLDADTIPANLNFQKRMDVNNLTGGRITANFVGIQRTVIEFQNNFTLFGWNPMVALLGITSQGVLRVEGDSGNQSIFLISRAGQVPLVSIRHSDAIGDAITAGANVADLAFWAGDPDLSSITKQVANIKVVGSGFVSPTSGEISGVMEFHIAKADTDTVGPGGNVVKMLPSGMEVLTGTDFKTDVSHTSVMQWNTGFTDYNIQPTGFNKHQTDGPMIYVAGGGSAEFPDRTLVILAQVFGGAKPIVIAAGFPLEGIYEQIKINYVTPVSQTITMSPHVLDVVGKIIVRGVTVLGDIPLPLPGNVTVVAAGGTGSTTWGYRVTAHNEFGETLATTEVTISNGNATLDGTNFNRIQWDHIVGASSYSIYRTTAGGTPSTTGRIATGIVLVFAKRGTHDDKADAASGAVPTVSTAISRIDAKSLLVTAASTVDNAGLRLLPGVAPTSPVDGDMWATTASAFIRINGVTQDLLAAVGTHVLADTTGLGPAHTTSGLTAGQVLIATGATAALFRALTAADVGAGTFGAGDFTFAGNVTLDSAAPVLNLKISTGLRTVLTAVVNDAILRAGFNNSGGIILQTITGGSVQDRLTISNNGSVTIAGTGPHVIGGAISSFFQLRITGTFAERVGTIFETRIQPPLNVDAAVVQIGGTIDEFSSGTHVNFVGLQVDIPTITAGAAAVTNAASVRIVGAPSAGTNNYALWVASGGTQLDGSLTVVGKVEIRDTTELLRLSSSGGNGRYIRFNDTTSVKFNWIVAVQQNVNNGFEITPSTVVGGSTFTSPALQISSAGNITLSGTLDVTGQIHLISDSAQIRVGAGTNDAQFYHDGTNTFFQSNVGSLFIWQGAAAALSLVTNGLTRLTIASGGDVTIAQDLTVDGDIILTPVIKFIGADTADGSDTGELSITAAGAVGKSRGSFITLAANDRTGIGGDLILQVGETANAELRIRAGGVDVDGTVVMNHLGAWAFGVISPIAIAGTINAKGVYDDGTLLTDYVFELAFRGETRLKYRSDYRLMSFSEARTFAKRYCYLPGMDSFDKNVSLGMRSSLTIEKLEEQFLYLSEVYDRVETVGERVEKLELDNMRLRDEIELLKAA